MCFLNLNNKIIIITYKINKLENKKNIIYINKIECKKACQIDIKIPIFL